jgi:hypothetical protein
MTSDNAAIRIRGVAHQFGDAGDARHVRALRDTRSTSRAASCSA